MGYRWAEERREKFGWGDYVVDDSMPWGRFCVRGNCFGCCFGRGSDNGNKERCNVRKERV
jgi:hypothetical protein